MAQWHPGKLLALSGQYWQTCTLHASVKLEIFSVIGGIPKSSVDVAAAIGADPDGIERLLNALSAMHLLIKDGHLFANTEDSASFLDKNSPQYIGYMIMHHHYLMNSWSRLSDAVVGGGPVRDRASFSESARESFLMGMFNMAMAIAPGLADAIDLTGRRHLLDLGGGPGTYAVHFALKNSNLKATVLDLPTTRPFAEKIIDRFNIGDRVRFAGADYTVDTLDGHYDVVWLSHILHAESPQTCQRLLDKAVGVLESGGLLLIHEFILTEDRTAPLFPALFSLNMLLGTDAGRSYTEDELTAMMRHAGLKEIRRLDFVGPTESGILCGVK